MRLYVCLSPWLTTQTSDVNMYHPAPTRIHKKTAIADGMQVKKRRAKNKCGTLDSLPFTAITCLSPPNLSLPPLTLYPLHLLASPLPMLQTNISA